MMIGRDFVVPVGLTWATVSLSARDAETPL